MYIQSGIICARGCLVFKRYTHTWFMGYFRIHFRHAPSAKFLKRLVDGLQMDTLHLIEESIEHLRNITSECWYVNLPYLYAVCCESAISICCVLWICHIYSLCVVNLPYLDAVCCESAISICGMLFTVILYIFSVCLLQFSLRY